ncbi:MAG TPA: hypothetical protein VHA09_02865 [Nitrososphaera sp.]|nr:hypothetical protein [Nitrososphaera sp.]
MLGFRLLHLARQARCGWLYTTNRIFKKSAGLVASILLVMPYHSFDASRSGMPIRISALDPKEYLPGKSIVDDGSGKQIIMNAVKVDYLNPRSFVRFLDSRGETMNAPLSNGASAGNSTSITFKGSNEKPGFQKRDP